MTRAEKDELLRNNRALLDQDLVSQRLQWRSRPRIVDIQLSNICNMSCTMCYDGNNPPPRKLDPELVERFAAEVLPTTAVMLPFAGSEPLIVTWDLARQLARRFDLELSLVTNGQFLDEQKFCEMEPFVSSLTISIDSHMRDVYQRIRLRSQPDKVFTNLTRAAGLCGERGIELKANVVFMVENAAFMDETVGFLADQGCTTVCMLAFYSPPDASSDRTYSDAVKHMSPAWVRWMLERVRRVAEQKRICIVFEGLTRECHDYRPADRHFRPDRKMLHSLAESLPHYFPGYCMMSPDHIKVSADGTVHPCCVAEGEHLKLGNLRDGSFEGIWKGPTAQDLRRAMLTLDLPEICRSCGFHTAWLPAESEHLPLVDWFQDCHCGGTVPAVPTERRTLAVHGPDHLLRTETAPTFRWQSPPRPVDEFRLVIGVAGTWNDGNIVLTAPGDATELRLPHEAWAALPPNTGLWWCLYGLVRNDLAASLRTPTLRCVVRHAPIPRVEGSRLYG